MSCLIVLQDGRACAPSAWGFEALLQALAQELGETHEERLLADWLRSQASSAPAGAMRRIDVRELTPENRTLFLEAVRRADAHCRHDLGAGWIKRLERLVRMVQSPDAISDTSSPVAPTGLRRGPGWRCAC